ncbi:Hypothetical protein CINCED_3A022369 [Cinara cedri]|uniref:Uncharacterized protein n=1 Tax=Cinara cedri TaxID=506608 RepID=A0A5E4NQI3_9HEMI|nr:Hypothetical protein CINCED_3A022369 [Cinara cedri]
MFLQQEKSEILCVHIFRKPNQFYPRSPVNVRRLHFLWRVRIGEPREKTRFRNRNPPNAISIYTPFGPRAFGGDPNRSPFPRAFCSACYVIVTTRRTIRARNDVVARVSGVCSAVYCRTFDSSEPPPPPPPFPTQPSRHVAPRRAAPRVVVTVAEKVRAHPYRHGRRLINSAPALHGLGGVLTPTRTRFKYQDPGIDNGGPSAAGKVFARRRRVVPAVATSPAAPARGPLAISPGPCCPGEIFLCEHFFYQKAYSDVYDVDFLLKGNFLGVVL